MVNLSDEELVSVMLSCPSVHLEVYLVNLSDEDLVSVMLGCPSVHLEVYLANLSDEELVSVILGCPSVNAIYQRAFPACFIINLLPGKGQVLRRPWFLSAC